MWKRKRNSTSPHHFTFFLSSFFRMRLRNSSTIALALAITVSSLSMVSPGMFIFSVAFTLPATNLSAWGRSDSPLTPFNPGERHSGWPSSLSPSSLGLHVLSSLAYCAPSAHVLKLTAAPRGRTYNLFPSYSPGALPFGGLASLPLVFSGIPVPPSL